MSHTRWLRERRPAPPSTLLARLEQVLELEPAGAGASCDVVAATVSGAEALLGEVVARPDAGRECALDLLTADAFATYAFEAASETPETLAEHAEAALRRFAQIGATGKTRD